MADTLFGKLSRKGTPSSAGKRDKLKALISDPKEFRHVSHSSNVGEAADALSEIWKTGEKLPTLSTGGSIGGTTSFIASGSQTFSVGGVSVIKANSSSAVDESVGDDGSLVRPGANRAAVFSPATVEKTVATKIYFEGYFEKLMATPSGRHRRRLQLEDDLESMHLSDQEKRRFRQQWQAKETEYIRQVRSRITLADFDVIKPLGRGAFGIVKLARDRNTGNLVALKHLDKELTLRYGQEGHVRAERDLLCQASDSCEWIVKLYYSFQDQQFLYLALEYMSGGDLLSLLIKYDIFPEEMARFYAAEALLAIEEAHRLGYAHRDIKPDNFLITAEGHLKLADFGLATDFHWMHDMEYHAAHRMLLETRFGEGSASASTDSESADSGEAPDTVEDSLRAGLTPEVLQAYKQQRRELAYSVVGTTNYMAPEVVRGDGHDFRCDLWSYAVILFEMLFGFPAFHHSSPSVTRQRILRAHYAFPRAPANVSHAARELVASLLVVDPSARPAITQIKAHTWFAKKFPWDGLRDSEPPWVPPLAHDLDTCCFDAAIQAQEDHMQKVKAREMAAAVVGAGAPTSGTAAALVDEALELRKRLAFKGFTFKNFQGAEQKPGRQKRPGS